MEQNNGKVFKLLGKVQHYAWGGNSFLPELLKIHNQEKKPFAEYWLGAHNNLSSELIMDDGKKEKLNEHIASFREKLLGKSVAEKFHHLPYLLKILDVKEMLSIQVHPSKKSAEVEFENENKRKIPLHAPHRNYKDDNHKPELMLALGEFWLLHGFKPKQQIEKILKEIPELNFLITVFANENYYELYKTVMELDQDIVNEILEPLLERIVPKYLNMELEKDDENFWAARASLTYNEPGRIDRGIFSIYLFNLVKLKIGDAVFQDAGLPHAYLEGQNVEIMANSDNVLRGGLTPKHIDVNELLKHVHFKETIPQIIHGTETEKHIDVFETPAPDFELCEIRLPRNEIFEQRAYSVQIFIVLQGEVLVEEKEHSPLFIKSGEAFVAFDQALLQISAKQDSIIYRAGVPLQ